VPLRGQCPGKIAGGVGCVHVAAVIGRHRTWAVEAAGERFAVGSVLDASAEYASVVEDDLAVHHPEQRLLGLRLHRPDQQLERLVAAPTSRSSWLHGRLSHLCLSKFAADLVHVQRANLRHQLV
jgi:hypothetical protein